MSFKQNGFEENQKNQNRKFQNQKPSTQTFDRNNKSSTCQLHPGKPGGSGIGPNNFTQNNFGPGENIVSNEVTLRTDFSGLFSGKSLAF